jgi:putative DNA primase/helicase
MTWANYDHVVDQIKAGGLLIDGIEVGTSRPVRCYTEDGGREKRGWYWIHDIDLADSSGQRKTYIVGAFGIYQGNDNGKQKIILKRDGPSLTADERAAIKARHDDNMKRVKAIRAEEARRAAELAQRTWHKYQADGQSLYLSKKQVKAYGIRYSPSGNGTLAVPMLADGKLIGLQIIRGPGHGNKPAKQYWPAGIQKTGSYHLIGGSPTGIALIAEGYATAATLHEATGLPVVVAFDAGSLLPVALAVVKRYRRVKILICADDDYLTEGNPGVTAARNAAVAVGGSHLAPVFSKDRAGKKITDFNDLLIEEGQNIVREQIEAHLRSLQWDLAHAAIHPPKGGGEKPEGRPQAVAVMDLLDAIDRFVPLDDGTGKFLFDNWTRKIAMRDQMINLLPAGVRWDDVKRNSTWINRGAYYLDQVGFDPSGNDPTVELNTWQGWPLKPKVGCCDRLLELIEYMCQGEGNAREVYHWLLCWMAYPLHHPGAKMSSAVIMHGPQGTGKSTIFKTLAKIYGAGSQHDYSVVLDQKALQDNFNGDWENKLFVLAEEVVNRSEMWQLKNELKELVTGEWLRIRKVFTDAYRQRNQLNMAFLSNENQPLPIDNDDRRHCVIWTPPQLRDEIYAEVFAELDNGGTEAFYHFLLNYDLGDFKPNKRPPLTDAKVALISLSLPTETRFINDWVNGDLDIPVSPCLASDLYSAYLKWCRMNGEVRPRASNMFHGIVARLPGWEKKRARCYADYHCNGKTDPKYFIIPPLKLLQENGTAQPENEDQAIWLSRAYLDFFNAQGEKEPRFGT